jgi:hypothetical protein
MSNSGFSILRTGPRVRVGVPGRLRFGWKHSFETNATIVDISERGMSVRCQGPLRLGMEVKAILDSAPDDVRIYHVVWFREAEPSEQGFSAGLELEP